jgi:hypothetical protein
MSAVRSPLVMKTGAVDSDDQTDQGRLDGWCTREEAHTVVEGENLAGVAGKARGQNCTRLALVFP